VVAPVFVVLDEARVELRDRQAGILLEQNTVLERMVPAFDFALGLRIARCVTNI
jgi:hypothetical protein